MRKYKIYYRFVKPATLYSSMRHEHNIEAYSCGEACDKLRSLLPSGEIDIKVLEVYEQVLVEPETIILPEDL